MVLELILAVLLLLVGSALASVMRENVSGNTHFSLDLAGILLVTIVGAGLFLVSGWSASLTVLGAYWAWCFLGGLSSRRQARAMVEARVSSQRTCPQCGAEVRNRVAEGSVVIECVSACGWSVATTNPSQPAFDSQLYDVLPLVAEQDKNRATARLAVVLGIPIRDAVRIVEQNEAIAKGVEAVEVQRLARLLAQKGIGIVVRPDFPWPLTDET
ncbi:MAG: hypothetical protein HY347_00110 [candidate division NC10 bacterium]|nr:hypothetical protein [candidate division NC10 bacterium]